VRRSTPLLAVALVATLCPAGVRAEGGLRKGPWLMDLRPGSLVVMAERNAPGALSVRAVPLPRAGADTDAGPATAREAEEVTERRLHELRLDNLRPDTRYRYTVTGPGITPQDGEFTTPPTPGAATPFRFALYGDTRSQPGPHRAVVEALVREAPAFAIHTGDLVEDGRNEAHWQEFFDIEAPLLRRVPFVPVIGNHEIVRPMSSGIENYRRYVHVTPDGPMPELDYVFRYGNARFVLANSYDDWTGTAREWLDGELARARREAPSDWLFVVMHWGPRSSGPHGDNELLALAGIDRILRRHRVDLVIAGHDHIYERGDDDRLRYLVTGGGGAPLYYRATQRSATRVFAVAHHYVRVEVEAERVRFVALRPDGTEIDRATLRRDGWEDLRPAAPAPAPTPAPAPAPAAPEGPPDNTLWKALPLAALVALGGWWLRRRG
jgi:hypothetical protein